MRSIAGGRIRTDTAAVDEERALVAADQLAAIDVAARLHLGDSLRRPRMRSANSADCGLCIESLAGTKRTRQFDLCPAEVGDNPTHGARGQGRHRSDYERLKDRGLDRFVLTKIGFIAPARIDLQRTKRVQPALREIKGAARPMYEGFAGDKILEIQAGLLDERSILRFVVELEPLLGCELFLGLVLGM